MRLENGFDFVQIDFIFIDIKAHLEMVCVDLSNIL